MELRPRRSGQKSAIAKLQATARFTWCQLPLLVQDLILRQLAGDYDGVAAQPAERLAVYASVCSEWQEFFEKIIFRKLVLHASDLDGFAKIVNRRAQGARGRNAVGRRTRKKLAAEALASTVSPMPRIQHIWLRVGLLSYQCPDCGRPQGAREAVRNNVLFTKALWALLDTLSTWEKLDANHGQRLTLELSAHSPSDSQHLLGGDAEHRDGYPYRAGVDAQREYIARHHRGFRKVYESLPVDLIAGANAHDLNHTGIPAEFGDTLPNFNRNSAERLISRLDFDSFGVRVRRGRPHPRLPEVKMVSEFLMRRQYHRSLSDHALMRLLKESLTGLRDLRYERWRTADPSFWARSDWTVGLKLMSAFEKRSISGSGVPPPLETFSMFEDFSEKMHGLGEVNEPRETTIQLAQCVASSALNIKNLCISFVSDAKDCLKIPSHTSMFPNLESIALTSQHWLEPTQANTSKLLLLAAAAAGQMPKLRIMEIWNCGSGHAAIFRYEATGTAHSSACRLTWRCSWEEGPERPIAWGRVVAAWRHVASTNAGRELTLVVDPLPDVPYGYGTYHAIIHKLKLRNLILDPTSVMQARVVTGTENEPEVEEWRPSVPDSYWSES